MKLTVLPRTARYSSVSTVSRGNPGPSNEYTAFIRRLTEGEQNAEAKTARLPPYEWPPTRSGTRSALPTLSR